MRSDLPPLRLIAEQASSTLSSKSSIPEKPLISFNRQELNLILNLYGRYVADGEWRDYALDFTEEAAIFSIYRRSAEQPLYRIFKTPALARKQGQYSVQAQTGLVLKRGQELAIVLRVLEKKPKLTSL